MLSLSKINASTSSSSRVVAVAVDAVLLIVTVLPLVLIEIFVPAFKSTFPVSPSIESSAEVSTVDISVVLITGLCGSPEIMMPEPAVIS